MTNGSGTHGWWRRNRWGLVGLVPAFALAMSVPVYEQYKPFWSEVPRAAVGAASDGWVSFDGASMRLTALAPATGLSGFDGRITLPPGDGVWKATVDFRATSTSALPGCDLRMEDSTGSTYEANPSELVEAGMDIDPAMCAPQRAAGKPPASWTTVLYFLAPSSVHPVAVQVLVNTALPRYARLTLSR